MIEFGQVRRRAFDRNYDGTEFRRSRGMAWICDNLMLKRLKRLHEIGHKAGSFLPRDAWCILLHDGALHRRASVQYFSLRGSLAANGGRNGEDFSVMLPIGALPLRMAVGGASLVCFRGAWKTEQSRALRGHSWSGV